MSKNSKTKTQKPAPVEITDLSQLEKLSHGTPVIVDVEIHGKLVRFIGRRLKPSETKEIKLLLEGCMPPLLPPEKEGGQPRYDFRDAAYLKEAEEKRRAARALAVYSAFPLFKQAMEKAGNPIDADSIVKFIESRELEDDVLELLFTRITERVVAASAYVGFF